MLLSADSLMKTDADVGIEASSAVTTSSTLWYGRWRWRCYRYQRQDKRWHGFVDASGCGAATAMQPLPAAVRTLVRPAASRSLLPAATLLVFVAVEVGEIGRIIRQINYQIKICDRYNFIVSYYVVLLEQS